jgi:hypothetical protein
VVSWKYRYAVWATIVLCWAVQGLSHRHTIVADGVNYLDLASGCLNGNFSVLVNGYWSPAYPSVLAGALYVFKPEPAHELIVVHGLNCVILVAALVSFEYFLRGLVRYASRADGQGAQDGGGLPELALRVTGYVLFFWATTFATPPSLETPDAMVFALVLLAAGILLRIAGGQTLWLWFAALGAVLGLAYLAKGVMFPLSFVFLVVSVIASGSVRRAVPGIVIALMSFVLVAGPFIAALSKSKGRFSFGETGKIAYAEYINGVPLFAHWQGGPPGAGTPVHPTRKILDIPPVYEFATPLGGSYPPSTDQSYWYDGVRPHFELRSQLNVLRHSIDACLDLMIRLSSYATGFLVLLLSLKVPAEFLSRLYRTYFLWIPSAAALGLYSLVLIEPRYVIAYVVLLWGAGFSALQARRVTRFLTIPVTLAMIFVLGVQVAWSVGHDVVRLVSSRDFPSWDIAKGLHDAGIAPGDRIACIGESPGDHYWARLAGVTIVAEVPKDGILSFVLASPEGKAATLRALGRSGARAVVAPNLPAQFANEGWQRIAGTDYYVLLLRE